MSPFFAKYSNPLRCRQFMKTRYIIFYLRLFYAFWAHLDILQSPHALVNQSHDYLSIIAYFLSLLNGQTRRIISSAY